MIELIKVNWSKAAFNGLAVALGENLHDVAADVIAGNSELWSVGGHGFVVTRFEVRNEYKTLILVGGQGEALNGNGYIESVKAFCNLAASAGADRVEISTHRPAIGRMVKAIGFEQVQTKYELNIREILKNG